MTHKYTEEIKKKANSGFQTGLRKYEICLTKYCNISDESILIKFRLKYLDIK